MAPDRSQQVKRLFEVVLTLPDEQREAVLGGLDPSLREEVESLLASHGEADSFLEKPPEEELVTVTREREGETQSADRRQIGPYRILQEIGHGGMGVVYEAEQENPRRVVAVKVMSRSLASQGRAALRRFEYEAQILARLEHPGIARIYEAGTWDDGTGGVPYFAMEYIPDGRSITEYVAARDLDRRERLDLFAKVCDAVHHGHQKGIIHRDLKPANIMIAGQGSGPPDPMAASLCSPLYLKPWVYLKCAFPIRH